MQQNAFLQVLSPTGTVVYTHLVCQMLSDNIVLL